MAIPLNQLTFSYEKKRFQDDPQPAFQAVMDADELNLYKKSEVLLIKAIKAAVQSSVELGGTSKVLPLQGVVDLATRTIFVGALTPKDQDAFVFNEQPLLEHKKPGLFQSGRYSPRLETYQTKYSAGPTAHQQLLLYASKKEILSADDAEDKRGIAFNIQVIDKKVTITVDGKSLSINDTAQYLRTIHKPGHKLTEIEAKNEVLKASGAYSPFCESWIYEAIVQACQNSISRFVELEEDSEKSSSMTAYGT